MISDVHANLVALEAVLQKAGAVDIIIHAGDIVDYNPWPLEVLKRIMDLNIITVMGNHDRDSATGKPAGYNPYAHISCQWTHTQLTHEYRRYLIELPKKREIFIEGLKIFLCHGSPYDLVDEYVFPPPVTSRETLMEFCKFTESDIVIMGHTHIPFVEQFSNKYVINPGSVGQPRDNIAMASYMILEIYGKNVAINHKRVNYNIEKVAEKIKNVGLPSFLAQRLFYGI